MYYDVCIHRRGKKVYRRELIRESFRRNRKGPKYAKHTPVEMAAVGTAETQRTQSTIVLAQLSHFNSQVLEYECLNFAWHYKIAG